MPDDDLLNLPACFQCLGTEVICVKCALGGTDACRCPNGPDETEPCPCAVSTAECVVVMDEQAELTQDQYETILKGLQKAEPEVCPSCNGNREYSMNTGGPDGEEYVSCDACDGTGIKGCGDQ